jgi:hypothetical protein
MKKILLSLVVAVTLSLSSFGQAPEGFKYQAVVRDAGNTILNNQVVGLRMTIQQGSIGGITVYSETFAPTTNMYGLVNLEVGNGTVISGTFANIDWSAGPYFMETAVDITGGTNYSVMGTSQLMSVPYALYAKTSGNGQGPAGVDGINGTNGINGIDGTDGAVGAQGPIGLTGPAGNDGATGPQGPAGNDGAVGATGPLGPQGPAGNDGATGPQGSAGNDGATGPQGPAGNTGATGPMGPQGPAGNDGAVGAIGPMGPQGPAGNDGAIGATGPLGPQGPAGNDGATGPQGSAGNDGAIGPQGPQGIQGVAGNYGAQGPQGIQGLAGNDGATGPQGIQGVAGNDGAQGLQGIQGPAGADGQGGVTTAGTNVTITGTGTVGDPYVVNAASGACGLAIGQTYQGGIIFYLDASGCHGLISAPIDQSTGIQWYNGSYTDTYASGSGLFDGDGNCYRIRRSQGDCANCNAAELCLDLTLGAYSDWYLPSKYELNLMYRNIGLGNALGLGNVGGFASNFYWSSTELDNLNAWRQSFSDGYQNYPNKGLSTYVRAVRAF